MDTSKMNLSQNRLYEKSDVSSLSKEGRNSFDFNNKSSNTSVSLILLFTKQQKIKTFLYIFLI